MKTPLHVALIGQKFMGRAHSNAWGQVNRFFDLPLRAEMHAVAGRDGVELAAFAEKCGWKHSTTDWRSLAKDARVQLVDIGTSNDMHAEMAIAALQAGKHVWCEKPMAPSYVDAERMLEAARASGKVAVLGYNYIQNPVMRPSAACAAHTAAMIKRATMVDRNASIITCPTSNVLQSDFAPRFADVQDLLQR